MLNKPTDRGLTYSQTKPNFLPIDKLFVMVGLGQHCKHAVNSDGKYNTGKFPPQTMMMKL